MPKRKKKGFWARLKAVFAPEKPKPKPKPKPKKPVKKKTR